MFLRKLIVADRNAEFFCNGNKLGKLKLVITGCFPFPVKHLDEGLPFSFFIHRNPGNEGERFCFSRIHHFKIPAFEIFSLFSPSLELFGVKECMEFSQDQWGVIKIRSNYQTLVVCV